MTRTEIYEAGLRDITLSSCLLARWKAVCPPKNGTAQELLGLSESSERRKLLLKVLLTVPRKNEKEGLGVSLRREPLGWRRLGIARHKNPRPARAVACSVQQRSWLRSPYRMLRPSPLQTLRLARSRPR
jgi:hypothetical protein